MRRRVGLALVLSLILILGAGASRFFPKEDLSQDINPVDTENSIAAADIEPEQSANLDTSPATTPEILSTTDLISRQLFGDYFDLLSTGEATPPNIDSLAGKYANAIVKMAQSSHVSAIDLNVVPSTEATLRTYYIWISTNAVKYQSRVEAAFDAVDGGADLSDSDLASLGLEVARLYEEEAELFKSAPVPQTLVTDHLGLTNTYFNNAVAYRALAESASEPISAIAGLASIDQNDSTESLHLENIAKALNQSGIMLQSQ